MPTRKEILEMLAQGRIDVTRATEMLNEASAPPPPRPPEPAAEPVRPNRPLLRSQGRSPPRRTARQSHLCPGSVIIQTALAAYPRQRSGDRRNRVRVNVPLGLVNPAWAGRASAMRSTRT